MRYYGAWWAVLLAGNIISPQIVLQCFEQLYHGSRTLPIKKGRVLIMSAIL
jgi:hypothetical protein